MYSLENSLHIKNQIEGETVVVSSDEKPSDNDDVESEELSIYDIIGNGQNNDTIRDEQSIYGTKPNENNNNNNRNTDIVEETEASIYDTDTTSKTETTEVSTTIPTAENYMYSAKEKKLCFIDNDIDHLPTEIIYQFGLKTLILDVSFNNFRELKDLSQFPYLEELICDNNSISENSTFPNLPHLQLFSCNKNRIRDLHVFIDKIKVFFPNINHLSLLGNEACPNQLVDHEKDDHDYARYRKYIVHRLPSLKFLDCYEVTALERQALENETLFYDVVKFKDGQMVDRAEQQSDPGYNPLPSDNTKDELKSTFGVCKYVYYGKQSEGNRFIKNDDL